MNDDCKEVAAKLTNAEHVVVLTGAGVSAESGIPTFRDALAGMWENFKPEDLATLEAFKSDPNMVYSWYQWRRRLISETQPNAGHYALAELVTKVNKLTLITQNVDGLHQRAGSKNVIEFHGNIFRNRCLLENTPLELEHTRSDAPPTCPGCGALARPDVIWFGEMLDPKILKASVAATQDCDTFVSIGTSSLVFPAAELGLAALKSGATLIEINPGETPLTEHCHYSLTGNSALLVPDIVNAMDPCGVSPDHGN